MTDDETIEFERLKTARDSLLLTVANLRGQLETIAAHEREECIQNVLQQYEGFGTEHQGVEYVKQRIVDAIKARGTR